VETTDEHLPEPLPEDVSIEGHHPEVSKEELQEREEIHQEEMSIRKKAVC
jgi:hypothetical protein